MQDWMRKHRRLIMFFILIFIGVPFVFMYGVPAMRGQQESHQDNVIAQVGGVPLMESEFRRNLNAAISSRTQGDAERPSFQDLDADGSAQRILEQMIDSALIKLKERDRDFHVNESLLVDQMRQWEFFQNESGQFNAQAWNEWVGSVARWDDIYDEMRESVARQVFLGAVTAPAKRVLDRKITEELKADHTSLRVKYAKVEMAVTPTEEEIQKHLAENPDRYRSPEQHVAEFIAVPMTPDMPELALDLVERARAGEDFAELAKEYSDLTVPEGGDMGWRSVEQFSAPHLEPLFALKVGEVSDPVLGPTGFFIYKNEEERTNEQTGEFEIRGRQIVLHTELDDEGRAAREALAETLAERLRGGEAPETVAADAGLFLRRTNPYDRNTTRIDHVSANDMFQFRPQSVAKKDTPWEPIKGRDNIYLTRIVETREGDVPPLEEVRERVVEGVINERKRTDEYREQIAAYADEMKGRIQSVADIAELYPELEISLGETEEPFTRNDMLFQQEIYVQTTQIFAAMKEAEPGDVVGPLSGFFGDTWFFELVERIDPSEEELAALEEERQAIVERLTQTAQFEILSDYTKDLRERMLASVAYTQDAAAFDRILGRDWAPPVEAPAEEEETPLRDLPLPMDDDDAPIGIAPDAAHEDADILIETAPDATNDGDSISDNGADTAMDEPSNDTSEK